LRRISRSYVDAAEARLGEPVVAVCRVRRSPSAVGGRGDWVSAVIGLVGLVMARRDSELPRRLVIAVTTGRVYVLRPTVRGVGRELASWDRSGLRSSAQRFRHGWEVWVQPPGDGRGFELRAPGTRATDALVAALTPS
jgi:hypothetical protein